MRALGLYLNLNTYTYIYLYIRYYTIYNTFKSFEYGRVLTKKRHKSCICINKNIKNEMEIPCLRGL